MLTIDLTGRKALVTGGARGIGAGIVRALAECGASVAFTHRGSERGLEAAEQLLGELKDTGGPVQRFVAAADDMEAMRQVASEAAEALGGLDIVVPNVGQNWVASIEELDLAWFKQHGGSLEGSKWERLLDQY